MTIAHAFQATPPLKRPGRRLRPQAGFTLIELMIVTAVVAILTAIAYPSYSAYVLKTRRATGAGCLLELAQWMERNHTTCLRYDRTGAGCTTAMDTSQLPALACRTDLGTAYVFSVAATPAIGVNAYQLEAAPGGPQVNDTRCGTLSINQTGLKGATGADGAARCWR